jgi:hypothetical protein
MNERLGIVDRGQARFAQYERYITLQRPEPADPQAEAELDAFCTDVAECLVEWALADRLHAEAVPEAQKGAAISFVAPRTRKPRPPAAPIAPMSIAHVQTVFIEVLWASGYRVKKRGFSLSDMRSSNRNRAVAWPRHVCMALVRAICPGPPSTPQIGRAFGNKDHTTVLYALKHAACVIAEWPEMADVHAKVLAAFKVPQ